jgi:hypothetical protein
MTPQLYVLDVQVIWRVSFQVIIRSVGPRQGSASWHYTYVLLGKHGQRPSLNWPTGRAMAQVVSRRPLTVEARVRARVNPCGIYGGQSGTGTGFSPSSSVFPCQCIIPPSLSKLISSGECVIC